MKREQLQADLALLAVALIWGATFVMVKKAVMDFPVFAFLSLRFVLAFVTLGIVIWWKRKGALTSLSVQERANSSANRMVILDRREVRAGSLVGLALFAGYAFQTVGLKYTSPSKAGFITGLSVVIVPLFSALFLRRSPSYPAILGVVLATVGLALLSLRGNWTIARGDALVLGCAFAFALHIVLVGAFASKMDPLNLTAMQIATVALMSGLVSLTMERPWPTASKSVYFAAFFTGIFATSLAFAVQNAAQRFTSPTHTALIFSTEPVFAALFGYLLAGERLGGRALLGCGLILAGMMVAEVREDKNASRGATG